jgi:hypothetical protein
MNRLFPIPISISILLRQPLIALLFLLSVIGFSNSMAAEKLTTNLSSGCIERYDPDMDYFPEKVTLDYAKGFSVAYFKHVPIRLAQVSPTGSGTAWSPRSTHSVLLSQPDRHFQALQSGHRHYALAECSG